MKSRNDDVFIFSGDLQPILYSEFSYKFLRKIIDKFSDKEKGNHSN